MASTCEKEIIDREKQHIVLLLTFYKVRPQYSVDLTSRLSLARFRHGIRHVARYMTRIGSQ